MIIFIFQSTLPRGERLVSTHSFIPTREFQSTLPRGERPLEGTASRSIRANFNPRSREGSDHLAPPLHPGIPHFNPRSREGSDGRCVVDVHAAIRFQSTLPRGERQDLGPGTGADGGISIHAPARGATLMWGTVRRYLQISIHAPARGATFSVL